MRALPTALAAALALLAPAAGAAPAKAERGALHGTVRWWQGTEDSWEEVVVTATWRRPQYPAWENRTSWVRDDAETFCGASGTITYRSHSHQPGNAARPDELKDPKRREELRRRVVTTDTRYSAPVEFNEDQVDLCVAIHPKTHRVLGRLRVDRKGGHFVVEPPWFNTFNNSVPWSEIDRTEVNALGESRRPTLTGYAHLDAGEFFDKGKGLSPTGGGTDRWVEEEPEPDGGAVRKRIVEWALRPGAAAPATLEVAGCGDLGLNESTTLSARATPTGGTFRWSVEGAVVELAPLGGATVVTCEEPGHALVQVAYTAPDGQRQETSKSTSCIFLKQPSGGEPLPVPLGDELGRRIERWTVPVEVKPPGALELLVFDPADVGVATAEVDARGLQVRGLKEGTTGLQARSRCGAVVGLPLPVRVVPCHPDVVARLKTDHQAAREEARRIGASIAQALGSDEFIKASDNVEEDAHQTVDGMLDLLMEVAPVGKFGKELYDIAGELDDTYHAIKDAREGKTDAYGQTAYRVAADRLEKLLEKKATGLGAGGLKLDVIRNAFDTVISAGKLLEDLQVLTTTSASVKGDLARLDPALQRVLKLGDQLKRCRASPAAKPSQPGGGATTKDPAPGAGTKPGGGSTPGAPSDPSQASGEPGKEAPRPPPSVPPPPPVPPPDDEIRPANGGLPIGCSCPKEEKVVWNIAGRRIELGTFTFGDMSQCVATARGSAGSGVAAARLALEAAQALEGLSSKAPSERPALVADMRARLGLSKRGMEDFQAESRGVPAALKECQAPLTKARKQMSVLAATTAEAEEGAATWQAPDAGASTPPSK